MGFPVRAALAQPAEPTEFLGSETARVLPDGQNAIAIGTGGPFPLLVGLTYRRGVGSGEWALNVRHSVWDRSLSRMMGPFPLLTPGYTSGLGLGYKHHLGPLGDSPWRQAVYFQAHLGLPGQSTWGLQAGWPIEAPIGPGRLTVQPRVIVRHVPIGVSPVNLGLMAGYDWAIGHQWHMLSQVTGGWQVDGSGPQTIPEVRLGVRYQVTPSMSIDAHTGIDPMGVGANYTAPYNQLLGLVGRYSY
jgi:hypothetical protein